MQIAARRLDQVTIFDITGHIDLANSPELRKVLLKELKETKTPRVILNLTGVRYIDSSGVASLGGRIEGRTRPELAFYFVRIEPFGERSVATVAIDKDF